MPIRLDNIQQPVANAVVVYSPKFFDKALTGSGKKQGVLNENMNPTRIPPKVRTTSENRQTKKTTYVNGQTTTRLIPISPLTLDLWPYMKTWPVMDAKDRVKMAADTVSGQNVEYWIGMDAHSVVIEETDLGSVKNGGGGKSRRTSVCYQIWLYAIFDNTQPDAEIATSINKILSPVYLKNAALYEFSCNPCVTIQEWIDEIQAIKPLLTIDQKAVQDYLDNFSCYTSIAKRSEQWQTTIHETLDYMFGVMAQNYATDTGALNQLGHELRNIETYPIPLDLYRKIYASVQTNFDQTKLPANAPANIAGTLCKQNLNLLLSDTLNHLDQNKPQLTQMPQPDPAALARMANTNFSQEQRAAITSTEPLILVQAGAGTGKSTTILGRIDWMVDVGVKPEDITVLSFTNAAADHITEKNPQVHSMTIARMIHTIYEKNFPNHELSSIETVINSLDIYYPQDDLAARFRRGLIDIKSNESDAVTWMNNFIEANYDGVMAILDTIKQTTLDLEIIICYQKIDVLVEPPEVQSRFLIIDEVQDNSIFEFIYALKYVDKHCESLFIVGDCSQTLYEFRASNPKALNVLEGSGVFAAYQLQTNYRSNQEILDFANVALSDIEANQYAQIQLRANSLATVTEQSFREKVNFKYYKLAKVKDFEDTLPAILRGELKTYLDNCQAKGETVTFLAYQRRIVEKVRTELEQIYPGKTVISLVPEKQYNSTVISDFIKQHWGKMTWAPTQNIITVIRNEIDNQIPFMYSTRRPIDKIKIAAARMIYNWSMEFGQVIADWQRQVLNGQLTNDQFLEQVRDTLLLYEIRSNAVRQSLLSSANAEQKKQQAGIKADFALSTIHSAKGLEFDHVVVIYQNHRDMDEPDKRMYYVAFTRAMQSEFIVAYDTIASPKIEADYKTIVDKLHQLYPMPVAVTASGADAATLAASANAALAIHQAAENNPELANALSTDITAMAGEAAPVSSDVNQNHEPVNHAVTLTESEIAEDNDATPPPDYVPDGPESLQLPANYMASIFPTQGAPVTQPDAPDPKDEP